MRITAACKKAVDISLGFTLAHVGINNQTADEAISGANTIGSIFGFNVKEGNSSVFSGTAVEFMKFNYYGTKGHIGFKTNSMQRALDYLKNNEVEIIEESIRYDDNGKLVSAYLRQEVNGFAVHIVRK